MTRAFALALGALGAGAAPQTSFAVSSSSLGPDWIVCSSRIMCVRPPCPIHNLLDLRSLDVLKLNELDDSGLSDADREALRAEDALFHGARVVTGSLEIRPSRFSGPPAAYPVLVLSALGRSSTPEEQALCRGETP